MASTEVAAPQEPKPHLGHISPHAPTLLCFSVIRASAPPVANSAPAPAGPCSSVRARASTGYGMLLNLPCSSVDLPCSNPALSPSARYFYHRSSDSLSGHCHFINLSAMYVPPRPVRMHIRSPETVLTDRSKLASARWGSSRSLEPTSRIFGNRLMTSGPICHVLPLPGRLKRTSS